MSQHKAPARGCSAFNDSGKTESSSGVAAQLSLEATIAATLVARPIHGS